LRRFSARRKGFFYSQALYQVELWRDQGWIDGKIYKKQSQRQAAPFAVSILAMPDSKKAPGALF
jgi:hypothetical protein